VGCPQDWVAVEDCDQDAHVGGKQGEEDPSPVKAEPELGSLRTVAQEGVKKGQKQSGQSDTSIFAESDLYGLSSQQPCG